MRQATRELTGKGVSFKNELLFARGINYDKLPSWQKRGVGIWKETYEKEGYDPIEQKTVKVLRTRLEVSYELPLGQAYSDMIMGFLV